MSTKMLSIRVPLENYFDLVREATEKKLSVTDMVLFKLFYSIDKKLTEDKYLPTHKINLVREDDAPPIVKTKIVDKPVQEQKPKIADIPKIIVDNRRNNAEKPKQKLDNYVGDFDKSKWIYLEAPLDRVKTEYTNEVIENWRMTRERAFKMHHYSFSWIGNNDGKQRIYDTFTGKQL